MTETTATIIEFPATTSNTDHALLELQAQIHEEVRENGRPAQQLMTWLLDRRNLEAAWKRVRSTSGASTPGVDGQTAEAVERCLSGWMSHLIDDLYHGRYQPKLPRWIDIPKPNKPGRFRRLGILTIRDRVVHTAIKQVLEPICESEFLDTSFAFRPGRSVPGALQEAIRLLTPASGTVPNYPYAVHLDVADCFDTIDHETLRSALAGYVADRDFSSLIDRLLDATGRDNGSLWWKRRQGIVQGSALSPLLCNLYLHPLDVALADLAQATHGGVRMLRYADDLLLLARDPKVGSQAIALIRQVLSRLHQRLGGSRQACTPIQNGVDWLGVRILPRPHCWTGQLTFGYVIPDQKVIDMLDRINEMTQPPSSRIDASAFNPAPWIVSINDQLREWRQAYLYADNGPAVFQAVDDHTRDRVGKLLQAITGVSKSQLIKQFRVKLPRGFWSWQVPGARLSVLSSLAPRAPHNLQHPPRWLAYAKRLRAAAAARQAQNPKNDAEDPQAATA